MSTDRPEGIVGVASLPESSAAAGQPNQVSGIAVRIPALWQRVDLDARSRVTAIAELVERALGDAPELVDVRREITAALRAFARDAADTGAVYAALLTAVVEQNSVQASLLINVTDLAADDDLAAALQGSADAAVESVELAIGTAARLTAVGSTDVQGVESPLLIVQYAVRVPGRDSALVFSFSSLNVDSSEAMARMFEWIARAARWQTVPQMARAQ